jgi:hypothetical protein
VPIVDTKVAVVLEGDIPSGDELHRPVARSNTVPLEI